MKFQKGNSASVGRGRPKGTTNKYSIAYFHQILAKLETKEKFSLFEEAIQMARREPKVMVAVLNKLLPNMATIDHTFPEDLLDETIQLIPTNGGKDHIPDHLKRFLN